MDKLMDELTLEPKSIWGVIVSAWQLFKASWVKVLPISIIYIILMGIVDFILPDTESTLQVLAHSDSVNSAVATVAAAPTPISGLVIFLHVVVSFIGIFLFAAMLVKMESIRKKEPICLGKAFGIAFRKYFLYLIAAVVFLVITVVGLFLLVVPGLFIGLLMYFFLPNILVDNGGIFSSIKHSIKFVWGHWWRIFATMVLGHLLFVIPIWILFFIVGLVAVLFLKGSLITLVLMLGMGIIVTLIVLPWPLALMLSMYHDLKMRLALKNVEKA